jgi:hypothetical protein
MRIRQTKYKFLYFVIAAILLGLLTTFVFMPFLPAGSPRMISQSLFGVLIYIGAIRWFRGDGENLTAPRPWWRATNKPTASIVLGTLYGVAVLVNIANFVIGAIAGPSAIPTGFDIVNFIEGLLFTFLFLNCASILRRRKRDPFVPSLARELPNGDSGVSAEV